MYAIIFQIILSIFLVLILGFVGYSIYDREYINSIKSFNTVKNEVTIIDGIYNYNNYPNTSFDTQDTKQASFINLSPSINQNGGGEYTYNFWLYRDNSIIPFNSPYKVLFLRGSKQKILYDNSGNCISKNNPYVLVKNPLVRISKDLTSIVVEYNTLVSPDALNSDGTTITQNDICSGSVPDGNMLGIYNLKDPSLFNKFVMITIVIQEISPSNDILSKNITNCKLYLNSTLVLDRSVAAPFDDSSLGTTNMKNNKGKFYLNPTGILSNDTVTSDKALLIADLKYYNYSLNVVEIESLYNAGFNDKNAVLPSNNPSSSNYIAAGPIAQDYKTPNPY